MIPIITFCANDSNNYLLDSICLPTGGKWNRTFPSNNSVSFNAINPAVLHANLGVGTHDFIYSYTDPTTGCFTADTIHITIYGLDTPDIIEDTFCQSNIPQLLKFTPSGGTWSSNVSSGYFTPSTAGWHKVWYKTTNTHGCSNADTAYILVKEQIVGGINLLTDTTGLCFPDTSVELEAYWNTATNYNYHFKWLYNNSTNSKVKITKNGTYKVVITSDSTPCPDTVSITINLPNCCNLNTNLLHGTLTNASITAGNYVLDGELRITGIVTIDNAHIYVKDCHAIIIVEQGARLEIRNSHIGYCPWKGIEVWGSIDACSSDTGVGCGQGELFMQGSIIDFAEIGVFAGTRTVLTNSCYSTSIDRQLLGGAVIKIFYSTFRHNNVDILFSEFNVGGFCVCGNLSSNSPSNGVIYSQIEHNIFGLLSDTFYRCEGENNNNTWLGQFFIAYDAAHGSSNWRNSCRHIIDCNENPDAWSDPYCHGNNISCCTGSNVNNSYFGNHANNPNPFQQSIFENNSYSPTCTGTPPYH
ncbi:MAG: hypothetical protein NTX03_08080 [Bacteroidetes bacterium]|nr:hypothetical protein [Bacteroidota bacterium]